MDHMNGIEFVKAQDSDESINNIPTVIMTSRFNPQFLKDIKEVNETNKEIAKDIIRIISDRDLDQRIAVESTEIFNGKDANFNNIITMIEKHKNEVDEEKVPAVSNDVDEVLSLI